MRDYKVIKSGINTYFIDSTRNDKIIYHNNDAKYWPSKYHVIFFDLFGISISYRIK